MSKDYKWFEVWFEDSQPPSVLLMMSTALPAEWEASLPHDRMPGPSAPSPLSFDVVDPADGEIQYSGATYQDACYWLWEDEYSRVTGRMGSDGEELPWTGLHRA